MKESRLRICSLNVSSLNVKLLDRMRILRKMKVDIACIQETKWKGAKTEYIRYKLWYASLDNARNEVGILVSKVVVMGM